MKPKQYVVRIKATGPCDFFVLGGIYVSRNSNDNGWILVTILGNIEVLTASTNFMTLEKYRTQVINDILALPPG